MSTNRKIIRKFQPTFLNLLTSINFFINIYIYKYIKKYSWYITGIIMDFWCWESPYKNLFTYQEYIWIDVGESWHDNSKNKDICFFDWITIPFEDNYFDSFIATEVFEHVFNLDHTLNEINRVLKQWWYWIITLPFIIEEHEQPYDFARYTSFGIIHMLKSHGFDIINHEKSWNFWQVSFFMMRKYIWALFSSKNSIINIVLKIFVIPFHILFIAFMYIIPSWNTNAYLNNLLFVKKIKKI